MTETSGGAVGPATYHVMLRVSGAADFRRAGTVRLEAMPPQGVVLEIAYEGRTVRGIVEAAFIPPGCEENCVGTVFVAEV